MFSFLLGEAVAHAGDQVLHQGPLHAPEGARLLGGIGGLDADLALGDVVADLVAHL
jgi:hypothetical protein